MPFRDPAIDTYLEHAVRMLRGGNAPGAIDALKRALTADPEHATAHALLAQALLSQRRLHAAAREAAEALRIEPDLPVALYVSAAVAIAERRWDDAGAAVATLLAFEPDDAVNLRLAATYERHRGDSAAAARLLARARELDPDDAETLCDLGELALARGDVDQAGSLALAALGLAPERTDVHVLAGNVALVRGDARTASEHVRVALRHDPADPGALHLLTAIKARGNPLLGLWWRLQVFLGEAGSRRSIATLLGMLIAVRLAMILAEAAGRPRLAEGLMFAWLAFCAYTWVAPALFQRLLARELKSVELRRDF